MNSKDNLVEAVYSFFFSLILFSAVSVLVHNQKGPLTNELKLTERFIFFFFSFFLHSSSRTKTIALKICLCKREPSCYPNCWYIYIG